MLVTDVPKNTNRRLKFHNNVRGTSMGCRLLAWSANTCTRPPQPENSIKCVAKEFKLAFPCSCTKVEDLITDRCPITDFIFKCHTFLRHVSMHVIDNCLKLKLSRTGSSTLVSFISVADLKL
jgi:hypothetical protein